MVAAETIDIATQALGLIEVEYDVLPAALTPREAMKPDAPRVPVLDVERPREGNIQQPVYLRQRGDVERGLAEADLVSESRFTLPTQYHVDIQTRCCIAEWDGARLTVYEASQGVWNVKRELAKSLGLEEDQVRVVVQSMGGGFGSKAGAQRVVHYAARLAMLAGRPVRLELTRPEEFMSHPRRYAGEVTMRLGAKRDGTLTALDAEIVLDIGSGSLYAGRYTMTLHQISELYRCPNVRVRIVAVYTNTGPTGPQRGVLDPIATFSTEAAIDDLAARLGMDPLALRLKNYAPDFQGLDDTTPPLPYTSKHLDACLATVAEEIGWEEPRPQARGRARPGAARRRHGRLLHRARRLRALLGQGRRGGAPRRHRGGAGRRGGDRRRADHGAADDRGRGAGAARRAHQHPPRRHRRHALRAVEPRLAHHQRGGPRGAAGRLPGAPAALRAGRGAPRGLAPRPGGRGRAHPRARRGRARDDLRGRACALMPGPEIRATGSRAPNPDDVIFRLFGAHGAEVEVDTETGEVRVLRIVCSHDIGRPINPKLVESQQYGGAVMGLGYGLYEEAEMDGKSGVLLTSDVHQYRVPTSLETPLIEARNVEREDAFYPYSAKPVGEAPLVGVMPAVRNAIRHALGIGIDALPITPARILEALAAQRKAAQK